MKLTKRRQRTAKKLVLPLIALAMMATMMFTASGRSPTPSSTTTLQPAPSAAARTPLPLRHR